MSKTITTVAGDIAPETLNMVPGEFDGKLLMLCEDDPALDISMDPDTAVRYVRADCLAPLIEELERDRHVVPGNSPGHSHDVPGVWDRTGNPEHLSGKPCERCRMWNEVKALVLS